MADRDIIQFNEGDKLTIEETNQNNLLLKEWALDNSASEAYIDSKMAELSTSLDASISSINTQISALNGQINNKISGTADTATAGKGYEYLSNGVLIQWGFVDVKAGEHDYSLSFQRSFGTEHYCVGGSWNAYQNAGDKSITWRVKQRNKGSIVIGSQLNGANGQNARLTLIMVGKG